MKIIPRSVNETRKIQCAIFFLDSNSETMHDLGRRKKNKNSSAHLAKGIICLFII